jgi:gamma-glutamylcyclotransferase (GGCT)/AIG2-like uncharacterized protein YtfP
MSLSTDVCHVFVYGTLQRGECRERMWPRTARRVETAYVDGTLYGLRDYPAMTPGNDKVRGEVWFFWPADMAETLKVLDQIEGFGQHGPDLYVRRIVECTLNKGATCKAYTYHYCRLSELSERQRILPDADGFCQWRRDRV